MQIKQLFTAVALGLITVTAQAETKGIQAVLFHCWDEGSRGRLEHTVATSVTEPFALSSAPYISRDHGCNMPEDQRLDNLAKTVPALRNAGIQARVIVFLDELQARNPSARLDERFLELWHKVIQPSANDPSVRFVVGASLEDQYSNANQSAEAVGAFRLMMTNAMSKQRNESENDLQARVKTLRAMAADGRLRFVRSPLPRNTPAKPDFSEVAIPGIRGVPGITSFNVRVMHESHGLRANAVMTGIDPQKNWTSRALSGYAMWSNDGSMVSYDCGRTERCPNCDLNGPAQTITAFAAAPAPASYRLMWRPAYNLFLKRGDTYIKTAGGRVDNGRAFDEVEVHALQRYLRGVCPAK